MIVFDFVSHWVKYLYHRLFDFDGYRTFKCPACGLNGPKKMKFSPVYAKLLLTCPRDSAVWGIDPLVPHLAWLVKDYAEVIQAQQAEEDARIYQREKQDLGIRR
jgi:hypothetical protein